MAHRIRPGVQATAGEIADAVRRTIKASESCQDARNAQGFILRLEGELRPMLDKTIIGFKPNAEARPQFMEIRSGLVAEVQRLKSLG